MRRAKPSFLLVVSLLSFSFLNAAAQTVNISPRITEAIDETRVTTLRGNVHPLARAEFDHGAAPPDLRMERMLLVLGHSAEQDAALAKLLDDQQDRSSAQYHRWLTPEEFGQRFGLADSDVQTITGWLQSHGFAVTQVTKGRTVIEFSGTAAQVEEAFHTSIHKYVVQGKEHWANASNLQIPTALGDAVKGVFTLHNFVKKSHLHYVPNAVRAQVMPGTTGMRVLTTFPGTPPQHALAPADVATIYNLDPNLPPGNALFPRVAVVARSDIKTADVENFDNYLPLNSLGSAGLSVQFNGPDPGNLGGGEEAEAVADASWSGALLASFHPSIILVVSATTNTTDGIDLSELYIIENNFGDVMTESFGGCEAEVTSAQAAAIAALAQQAAAQGITYVVASGDNGAEGCDDPSQTSAQGPLSVNVLASTPYTTAVGGTTFNEHGQDSTYWGSNAQFTLGSAKSYIPEDVWNDSCSIAKCGANNANLFAGSGGFSTFFSKPSWQSGVAGIPNDGARDVPDISFSAGSHDPYLFCLEGSCVPDAQGFISFAVASGTSLSTPVFAGIMGLVVATTQSRQGHAGYVLYKLAANNNVSQCNGSSTTLPAKTCIFNDVTVGNNAVPGEANFGTNNASYQSGAGYDLATGLGSLNIMNLLNNWAHATFSPTVTTIVNVSPLTTTHGQPVNIDVTVTSNAGTPSGAISLEASNGFVGLGVGLFPLVGGQFASSISSLPGGDHSLTATYGGDGTFAPSSSAGSPFITVNPEASTTTMTVLGFPNPNGMFPPFTTGPYGSFVYLRADVAGQSHQGIATGGVVFADTTDGVIGGYSLNSTGNTATPNGFFRFSVGSHNVSAAYGGDASFKGSTSTAKSFTITRADTTTSVTATEDPQGVVFSATVNTNSGGDPPSGSLVFVINGVNTTVPVQGLGAFIDPQSDAVLVGAQGTATYTDTSLRSGQTYNVTASYSGSANYVASSGTVSGTVQPDFSIVPSVSTLTVQRGQSASATISIIGVGGYNGAISFTGSSCTGLPTESSCSFSPASVTGTGNTTLAIATMGAHPITAVKDRKGFPWWNGYADATLVSAVLIGMPLKRRRRIIALIAIGFVTLAIGCGGGGATSTPPPPKVDPGTPAGTYTITVTATPGSSGAMTHTTTVKLVVN
jgi:Pro-kumamolisin, activation domain/Bacterial Ig-like domain (group 3)